MVKFEYNKINNEPYIRVTSDRENYFVKIKGSEDEPRNEIMVKGETTELEFEELYVEPEPQVEEPEEEIEEGE